MTIRKLFVYRDYFLAIVNQEIVSIEERFKRIEYYCTTFGFLYNIPVLKNTKKEKLVKSYPTLATILRNKNYRDIDRWNQFV